jgi:hypothetical protein
MALGIADRVWTIGDLLDAALVTQPITSITTAPDRRKRFRVIEGGKSYVVASAGNFSRCNSFDNKPKFCRLFRIDLEDNNLRLARCSRSLERRRCQLGQEWTGQQ